MCHFQPRAGNIVWLAIVFEGGLLLLAWGLGWLLDCPPFVQVHLEWQALAWGVIATFPPLLALLWCTRSQLKPFTRVLSEIKEKLVPLFIGCSPFDFALISILAGFGEEALFRGVIQTTLADSFDPRVALVVTSTLFGLAHLITRTYAVLAGLIGLYLGWLSMSSNNLLVPMVVHALYDFVALMYLVCYRKAPHEVGRPPGSVHQLRDKR